ncbi:MAG: hypothetical protein ABI839_06150 [Verrucomicrobiota bacterium]
MRARFLLALAAELLLFAALNLFDDWTLEIMPIKFVGVALLAGLAYLLAASEFVHWRGGAVWIFWGATIALRLLALPLAPADETWRYQADGVIQRAGFDPYAVAPGDDRVTQRIPERARVPEADRPSAFAPGAEILFRGLRGGSFVGKLWFAAAELLAIGVLLRFVDLKTAAWLAWNPLLAYSFAGAGHFESVVLLAIVALLLCLVRMQQEEGKTRLYAFGAAVALGVAVSLRPVCLVLLLPTIFALRRRAWTLALGAVVPIFCALPFPRWPHGFYNLLGDFPKLTRLNDLFWWLIEETLVANRHERFFRYDAVIVIVATLVGLAWWRHWQRSFLWCLAVVVILTPVLHPWYLAWILPVATWRRAFAWHFLSVTIFAYYLFYNERLFALPWHAEPWLRGMILLPVLIVLGMLALRREEAPAEINEA